MCACVQVCVCVCCKVREEVEPGDFLTVRLVDAGADNVIGGNDDTSSEITLTNTELKEGEWLSL